MSNLIECIDCGNQVSKRAETCPKCGAPVDVEISEPLSKAEPVTDFAKEYEDSPIGRLFNYKAPSVNKKIDTITKIKSELKKDPNKNLIIVIVSIAAFFFLLWASTTDTGKKIWDSEYRECREVWREFVCKQDH